MRPNPTSPDGRRLIDYLGPVDDQAVLAASFDPIPGVVSHGPFTPQLISESSLRDGYGAAERWRKE